MNAKLNTIDAALIKLKIPEELLIYSSHYLQPLIKKSYSQHPTSALSLNDIHKYIQNEFKLKFPIAFIELILGKATYLVAPEKPTKPLNLGH